MLLKQKSPSFPGNLALATFGELLTVFSTNVNMLYLLYSMDEMCLTGVLANLFAKSYSKNSNLDESGIALPVFPSRTNLKLHNIFITPKMVKKVITDLNSWSWLQSSGGSKELWTWAFIHTSWTLQYTTEKVLFSGLLEGLIVVLVSQGYLRCKTITSQNLPSKTQIKNFFIS